MASQPAERREALDRALITVVPHTTGLRGSPFEIAVREAFLKPRRDPPARIAAGGGLRQSLSGLLRWLLPAGFQVTKHGRIWVTAEVQGGEGGEAETSPPGGRQTSAPSRGGAPGPATFRACSGAIFSPAHLGKVALIS